MSPINIRLPKDLVDRIEDATDRTGLSKNDIIKLTIDAGLKWLAANDYDLTRTASFSDAKEVADSLKEMLDLAVKRLTKASSQKK